MFAARNVVQRNLLNARKEQENSGNFDAAADEGNTASPDNAALVKENNEAKKGGEDNNSSSEEEEEEELKLIPLDGLSGIKLLYVRLANLSIRTLANTWFNSLVMLCISWASLSVGLQTYPTLSSSVVLDDMDLGVLSVFILECVIKILAEGLAPWRFFTGKEMRWNTFDFVIIVMSLPVWGSALGGSNIAILRMLRLMRIMKLVKRVPQLYMIVMGLIGGLKSIGYIMLLLFLVFYLYAISGMYAWQDNDPFHFRNVPIAMVTLFRMSTLENWSNIMNLNYFGCDKFDGGYYTNDTAEAANFQYCNTTALFGSADPSDSDKASTRMTHMLVATFYFITFILISAFVMLSLFIGAITMSMTQSMEQMKAAQEEAERKERVKKAQKRALEAERREREAAERRKRGEATGRDPEQNDPTQAEKGLSTAQKKERRKMREVLLQTWDDCDLTDILTVNQGDNKSLKGRYLMLAAFSTKIVESSRFTGFVTGVICLAGLLVGLQTSPEVEDAIGDALSVIDSMILAVFTTEVVLKLVAEGLQPWMYFKSAWNTFDFVIVVGSFTRGKGGMLTMLRLLRLLRVLKLVRAFPQLQVIVSALMKGVSSIGYIGLILMLCFYVFGIIGNVLFAENDPYHFQYLHFAMISLFQCATMDGWSDVLYINYYGCDNYGYDGYRALGYTCKSEPKGFLAVFYFCSFIVIGAMVLITLFIGVVTTSMEEATQEMEDEKALMRRIEELRIRKGVDQTAISSYMQVFRMLDLDNSGSVEEAELRIGLAAIGKYPTYDELKEMMDVVDEDGSGQIDIVEFVEFMIHVREKSNEQKAALQAARDAAAAAEAAANGINTNGSGRRSGRKSGRKSGEVPMDPDEVTAAVAATDEVVQAESRVVRISNDDQEDEEGKKVRRESRGPTVGSLRDVSQAYLETDRIETNGQGLTITSVGEMDYMVRIEGSDSPVMPMLPPSAVPSSPIAKSLKALSSRPSTPRSGRPGSSGGHGTGGKIVPSG